ncbi:hypothetical protein Tco_1198179 [Tanacetum coccineum]
MVGVKNGDDGRLAMDVGEGVCVDEGVSAVWWCEAAVVADGGGGRRVEESGCGDRIDPVTRSHFGVRRKNPPENFSGGGAMGAGGEGGGRIMGEGEEL